MWGLITQTASLPKTPCGSVNLSKSRLAIPAKFYLVVSLTIVLGLTAACESPVVYRPEVEQFEKATAQAALFMEAQQRKVTDLRAELRKEVLQDRRPFVEISGDCTAAVARFNQNIASPLPTPLDPTLIDGCRLLLPDDTDIEQFFNPHQTMANAAAFAKSVAAYAAALNDVATTGDREGFIKAVEGVGNAATSLATSAATAAGDTPPNLEALGPIAAVIGRAAFYYLENRRAEALKDAANSAHQWIETGSQGVIRVLYAQRFEQINVAKENIVIRVDAINEANANSYVEAAEKAIRGLSELEQLLSGDVGATFRKLPDAHQKLIDSFEDRERHLENAIAGTSDLFEAARAARAAITED